MNIKQTLAVFIGTMLGSFIGVVVGVLIVASVL